MESLASLPHVTLLPLDVTSTESLAAAAAVVSEKTGGRLDYQVNIASIAGLMYPPYMGRAIPSMFLRGHKVSADHNQRVSAPRDAAFRCRLPANSLYKRAEKEIAGRAVADRVGPKEDFARDLTNKVLREVKGRIYVGKMSTMVRMLTTWFPNCVVDYLTVANTGLDHLP
ncbi:oxidoreductase [Hypoxylon cercidicola]|nr:oxidoreductase [Hypoxylon cercidicola]